MSDHLENPVELYTRRADEAERDCARWQRQWSLLGNARLVIAIIAGYLVWQVVASWSPRTINALPWGTIVALALAVAAFAACAVAQVAAGRSRAEAERRRTVSERARHRYRHEWTSLPEAPAPPVGRDHPYAWDLNVVGPASLIQRIGTPVTAAAWARLYDTLLNDPAADGIENRQAAIRDLASQLARRQAVEAHGLDDDRERGDPHHLVSWGRRGSPPPAWRSVLAIVMTAVVVTVVGLAIAGVVPYALIAVPIIVNGVIAGVFGRSAAVEVRAAGQYAADVAEQRDVVRIIASSEPDAPVVRALVDRLRGADVALTTLASRLSMVIPAGSMLYFPLQLVSLWDIHLHAALGRWRARHGAHIADWIDAEAEWEALAALSVLAHDHPEWTFPAVDPGSMGLAAHGLAHPLLPVDAAVPNDVAITPSGSFLFVTGSNMSGKSTLLRAIGLNAVLAQVGAPVRARSIAMPPLRVSCCMRVEDSLDEGVSFFMAELRRLKSVIDRVRTTSDTMSLYLLDEMLQGTNTGERQIASRLVLRQLTGAHAIGAISSHDLELLDASLERSAQPVHFADVFSEHDGEASMTFDYQLRPGVATSTNALHLMRILGFELSAGDAPKELSR